MTDQNVKMVPSARKPFTCGNPDLMWPDVAQRLLTLAPNLAPRKLVSSANVRHVEQAAGPPPPAKPAAMNSPAVSAEQPARLRSASTSLGTPRTRDPLTLYLGTSIL